MKWNKPLRNQSVKSTFYSVYLKNIYQMISKEAVVNYQKSVLLNRICPSHWPTFWWRGADWNRLDNKGVVTPPSLQYTCWFGSSCTHTLTPPPSLSCCSYVFQKCSWRLLTSQHSDNVLQGELFLLILQGVCYYLTQLLIFFIYNRWMACHLSWRFQKFSETSFWLRVLYIWFTENCWKLLFSPVK